MPKLVRTQTITNDTGSLSVIEKILPFDVKRVFYLSNVKGDRGKHAHKTTHQALTCIQGSCKVDVKVNGELTTFVLDSRDNCLIVEALCWHRMYDFTPDAILLCLASKEYDPHDYLES